MLQELEKPLPSQDIVLGIPKEEYLRLQAWIKSRVIASKVTPSAEVVTLTPALAKLLLTNNPDNRPLSKRNSSDLANDILNKRWEFNGESIVVAKTGQLIDGQHRCMQVADTGRSIETVIVFGPRESARFTIDIGKAKTVSNFLAMKGKRYTGILAAAVNYHVQWTRNGFLLYGGSNNNYPTKPEILAAADELRGMETSVEFTSGCHKTVKSHAVLSFTHFVFWKKAGREAADHFMLKVIEGDGLRKGDPILYCRNRLMGFGRAVPACSRAELIFKCWNAHRLGYGIDHFKLTGGKLPKLER